MTERWLPIPEWEGLYEVSDWGRVRSLDRLVSNRWPGSTSLVSGRILKTGTACRGHLLVNLHRDGRGKVKLVHALVMLAFVGERPEGLEVCHGDGNPTNNHLENLRYGTRTDNRRDQILHGTDFNASKTHCPRGHAYSPENTYTYQRRRSCRTCRRMRRKARIVESE